MSPSPRWKKITLAVVASAVFAEMLLQVGAVVIWARQSASSEPAYPADARVVLCVGDSFTFGLGADSPAGVYPAQLEQRLRDSGGSRWHVANGGYPGRTARDLLEHLDYQLALYQPELVYILVGLNDQWRRPPLLELDRDPSAAVADAAGFDWKLRTALLAQWVWGRIVGADDSGRMIALAAEGGFAVAGSAGGHSVSGDGGVVSATERSKAMAEAASLRSKAFAAELEGNLRESENLLHAAVELDAALDPIDPDGMSANYQLLSGVKSKLGQPREAVGYLQKLERLFELSPSGVVAERLMIALQAANEGERCVDLGRELSARFPDNGGIWWVFGWQSFQAGMVDEGIEALKRSVKLTTESGRPLVSRLCNLAIAWRERDRVRALVCLVGAHAAGGAPDRIARLLRNGGYDRAELMACFEQTRIDETAQAELLAMLEHAEDRGGLEEIAETYEGHLRQLVARCREAGADPVLVGYPFRMRLDSSRARIAGEQSIRSLVVDPEFTRRLKLGEDLFAGDNHPNTAGYGIIADRVCADVMAHAGER